MEISIGIRDSVSPVNLDVDMSADELMNLISSALDANSPVKLTGTDGTILFVPAASFGYVRIAKEEQRRVGFGFV
ncbi:hypothetical protein JOD55_000916 [Arcanobacterium pluranimalium]|uniref:DUF3107 domain-containing protein n=1 Tax=Arcanobacterium pluranimalium TaxID=108028 RepID=UPI001958211C|nr:DUF3107 domain-containing protein [Arcanobacterium pluranimalium]MBM7825089.1 hypothetical protein [Arcanobacterium pluranimalium]